MRLGSPMGVCRHPMRRWGAASQATLRGEPHAPARRRAQEGSRHEAVRDGDVPWCMPLKRGSSYGAGVPGPPFPMRPANAC